MDKPFDSKITIGVGDRGEDVVVIPRAGVSLSRLGPCLGVAYWLLAWAGGLVMLVIMSFASNRPPTPAWWVFLGVALVMWVPCGAHLWAMLRLHLLGMFGRESLAFEFDQVVHSTRVVGSSRTRRYRLQGVARFERGQDRPRWWQWSAPIPRCKMVYGKRRIPTVYGATDVEADWLVNELNALLGSRRG